MTIGTRDEVQEKLRSLFVEVFARPFTGAEHTIDSVEEWDSLSHIRLIISVERAFKVRVDPDAIAQLYSSFDTVTDYLLREAP